MKRRRTKDYVNLLKALISEANKFGFILKPSQVMIDFEIATKIAFEKENFEVPLRVDVRKMLEK